MAAGTGEGPHRAQPLLLHLRLRRGGHRGGASRVLNIDTSRRVLDWGEENARLNGQPVDRYDYVAGDVFDWLGRLAKKGQGFDVVISDPPSFSTTRTTRFSAAQGLPPAGRGCRTRGGPRRPAGGLLQPRRPASPPLRGHGGRRGRARGSAGAPGALARPLSGRLPVLARGPAGTQSQHPPTALVSPLCHGYRLLS